MTAGFVGRESELALLDKRLAGIAASGTGTALVIRGRRQVGKSRLAQEFCDRAGVPYLFYTAPRARRRLRRLRSSWQSWVIPACPATTGLCLPT
jgi:uncharacterized protein